MKKITEPENLNELRERVKARSAQSREDLLKMSPEETCRLVEEMREYQSALEAANETLQSQQNFLAAVLENVEDGIVACDENGHLSLFNRATRTFHGIPEERLPPAKWAEHYDLYHPDGTTLMRMEDIPLFRAFRGETVKNQEMVIAPNGGERLTVLASGSILYDSQGKKAGAVVSMHNITERKKAEDALFLNENKYRTLLESLTQSIFYKDKDSVYLTCNKMFATNIGTTPDALVGKTDYDFFSREMAEKYRADDREVIESGKAKDIVETYFQDGVERFVHTVKTPVRNEKGEVTGMLGIFWDVTEEKRLEEALVESERKYRNIINTAREGFCSLNKNWEILEVNDSFCKMLGYRSEELIGRRVVEFVVPEVKREVEKQLGEITSTAHRSYETIFLTKDGSEVSVMINATTVREPFDQSTAAFSFITDISESKKAKESLIENEKKFRGLFEHAADYAIIFEPSQEHGLVIVDMNEATCKKHGYSREELLGKPISFLDSSFKPVPGRVEKMMSGETLTFEVTHKCKDGSTFPVEVYARGVQFMGKPYFFSIERDITERKRMQKQLIETEKLSTLGTFISGIAHELNNPLTAVLGFSQRLMQNEALSGEISHQLRIIAEESQRAARIVEELLRYSRKTESREVVFPVKNPVENSLRLISPLFHKEQIMISTGELPVDLRVKGDEGQIQQVVFNIMTNALHELKSHDGKKKLSVGIKEEENRALIYIQNSGKHIPEENLGKIFDPFFTTKKIGAGTGLGLYLSRTIIQNHGGDIQAENIVKDEVRFVISLPVTREMMNEADNEIVQKPATRKLRILIVEDEKSIRALLETVISEMGHQAVQVANGKEATSALEHETFDLVISDLRMNVMDGYELGKWLSEKKPEYLERFVLISGDIADEVRDFCKEYGCELLPKPFGVDEIAAIIGKRERTMDEENKIDSEDSR